MTNDRHRTAADLAAEREAILDRAQAERRNLTADEEQRYLALRRLEALARELADDTIDRLMEDDEDGP